MKCPFRVDNIPRVGYPSMTNSATKMRPRHIVIADRHATVFARYFLSTFFLVFRFWLFPLGI